MSDDSGITVPEKDKTILRRLAEQVARIGNLPIQKEQADIWRSHNDLKPIRPMVLIFPEGAWREMLPSSELTCESGLARGYEQQMRISLYYWEHMQDDNVIEPVISSPIMISETSWGIDSEWTWPEYEAGAGKIEPVIHDESDLDKLQIPEVTVDWEGTERRFSLVREIFGDILAVEKTGRCSCGIAPLDHYSMMRGIDNMFLDMVDNPGMVHGFISKFVDGYISMAKSMEEQGALTIGNRNHYVGSGGTAYTSQLPQPDFDGTHVRTMDQWGFASAQIFSEVSPAMHEEFALRHEKRLLELYGLNCYGCCEPLHLKLDIVKTIPRLRRVSISPWADVKISAEELGDSYIYSWKPNPTCVATDHWYPDAVRKEIRQFLETTRGCVVEMIMKDTHTCRNEPYRMWEWVRIAKEEAAAFA